MQAYRDFINTLVFQPNPNQTLDRWFPTAFPTKNGIGNAAKGRKTFLSVTYADIGPHVIHLRCDTCHLLPQSTLPVVISAPALRESQDFKIPHLRNVYQKLNVNRAPGAQSVGGFGIMHDGADADLFTFLSRPFFDRFSTNAVVKRDLDAFLQCFDTGMAPAVGYTRTLGPANANSFGISSDWTLLENQAAVTNIDLIVKSARNGQSRGFLYQPAAANYAPDSTNLPAITRAQLQAKALAGETITVMGVPPGSGTRLAIDRNLDGVLDGDTPAPALRIIRDQDHAVVCWSTNSAEFVLERADSLSATNWMPAHGLRGIIGDEFGVTNLLSPSNNLFFRLREL
jgi:hypothetical protein